MIALTAANKKTIIIGRVIDSMLITYEPRQKTNLHKNLEIRMRKGLGKQAKKYGVKEIAAVIQIGKEIWFDAIDHFADENITIEASNLVLRIVQEDEKALEKAYGLSKGILGRWAKPTRREDAAELENRTGEVVRHLLDLIHTRLGIETTEKPSVLNAIRWAKQENKKEIK